jgi:glutathione synthase/RimK-type ligase-like ATP-grasp enzyme
MARKAAAEGLVVIDDPHSILRCTNKVFLAELLSRRKVPIPRSVILHSKNLDEAVPDLGLPCILKEPDSSFSQGVFMAKDPEVLAVPVQRLLKKSELVIAQEFLPTDYDWRVGGAGQPGAVRVQVFHGPAPLADPGQGQGRPDVYGRVETLPVAKAPKAVVNTALKAAAAIGNGLYGVDLKQVGKKVYVIEVNDNPSIEAGAEDDVLGMELYLRVMEVFLARMRERTPGGQAVSALRLFDGYGVELEYMLVDARAWTCCPQRTGSWRRRPENPAPRSSWEPRPGPTSWSCTCWR